MCHFSPSPSLPYSSHIAFVCVCCVQMKRLPIVDPATNKLVNIVSQSTLVKLIAEQGDKFDTVVSKTLEDLGLGGPSEVFSIRSDQAVKDAFDIIRKKV